VQGSHLCVPPGPKGVTLIARFRCRCRR
jgi:hypothetical protein